MTTLFVYGTLKKGGSNHHFLAGQTFLGSAQTRPGYTLYSLGSYPGLVASPADTSGVSGELWSVDAPCLARLDVLEGLADGLYRRATIELISPATPSIAETYYYCRSVSGRSALGSTWPV